MMSSDAACVQIATDHTDTRRAVMPAAKSEKP